MIRVGSAKDTLRDGDLLTTVLGACPECDTRPKTVVIDEFGNLICSNPECSAFKGLPPSKWCKEGPLIEVTRVSS